MAGNWFTRNWDLLVVYVLSALALLSLLTCSSWGCLGSIVLVLIVSLLATLIAAVQYFKDGWSARLLWYSPHALLVAWGFLNILWRAVT